MALKSNFKSVQLINRAKMIKNFYKSALTCKAGMANEKRFEPFADCKFSMNTKEDDAASKPMKINPEPCVRAAPKSFKDVQLRRSPKGLLKYNPKFEAIKKMAQRRRLMKMKMSGFESPDAINLRNERTNRKSSIKTRKAKRSTCKVRSNAYWAVDRVMLSRQKGTIREYLIRWKGNWPDSWEPESLLKKGLIRKYNKEHGRYLTYKISCSLVDGEITKWSGFVDKRFNWNDSGYKRGLIPDGIEQQFVMNGETCALVRFNGQALLEILRLEDVLRFSDVRQ